MFIQISKDQRGEIRIMPVSDCTSIPPRRWFRLFRRAKRPPMTTGHTSHYLVHFREY